MCLYFQYVVLLAFGQLDVRINCWAHCIRLIDDELCKISDQLVKSRIRHDICCIQLSNSHDMFTISCDLFLKKWRQYSVSESTQ